MSRLAIQGGAPVRSEPFAPWPIFDDTEAEALQAALASRKWTSSPYIGDDIPARQFAQRFATYHDAQYGIATSSGTGALQIAFAAAGVRPSDEVIAPPNTFIAGITPILHLGAVPVFVDVDPETLNLDPDAIEAAITERTRVISPVHLAGYPCDMDRINAIAHKHGLKVVADACHAHGSEWRGTKVGALADLSAFSFQQGKSITAGEGGAVITNDRDLFETCFMYHNDGRGYGENGGQFMVQGWNFRMSAFQAAVLGAQLDRLDDLLQRKAEAIAYIEHGLSEIEGVRFPRVDSRVTRLSHLYPRLIYDAAAFDGVSSQRFAAALRAEGMPVGGGSGHVLYQHPLFAEQRFLSDAAKRIDYAGMRLPTLEAARGKSLMFDHAVLLSGRDALDDFIAAFQKVSDNVSELKEDV
jgi:dTDP-4-amino-4,6-dideoxygalactose transaminase